MKKEMNSGSAVVERLEWIEPEVRTLDVRETAFRPHGGADGETRYSDCNAS